MSWMMKYVIKWFLFDLPCWLNWATAAGNLVETATGVAPIPGIFISVPRLVFDDWVNWKDNLMKTFTSA